MDEDFLTYNQQMKCLRNNKKIICSGSNSKTLLCRYGYFNLVSGHKTPFLAGENAAGEKYYLNGTTIDHLNEVRRFDVSLRMLLLQFIVQIEEEVRSFAAYKFDEINKGSSKKKSFHGMMIMLIVILLINRKYKLLYYPPVVNLV